MVWLVVIRIGVSVLADRQASSWAWCQQVHLVRLDKHGAGLPLQPDRKAREVEGFHCGRSEWTGHRQDKQQKGAENG